MKFKIGDRVKVYYNGYPGGAGKWRSPYYGELTQITTDWGYVKFDTIDDVISYTWDVITLDNSQLIKKWLGVK